MVVWSTPAQNGLIICVCPSIQGQSRGNANDRDGDCTQASASVTRAQC